MSDKPVIFISHSFDDEELANQIGQEIEKVFDNQVKAFVARFSITSGEDWNPEIFRNLKAAQAFVVIISPSSEKSRWVGIEIGYVWDRIARKGKGRLPVYPLCKPGSSVFSPLDGKQGKVLNQSQEIMDFFQSLVRQFQFGDPTIVDATAIVAKVNGQPNETTYEGYMFRAPEYNIGDTPYG